MKVEENNHLPFGGLEEGMLHIVKQDVHTVSLQCRVAQSICVALEGALHGTSITVHQFTVVVRTSLATSRV